MRKLLAKLLIVEDDPSMRSALTLALKTAGYDVESAENGLHALETTAGKSFDLIISDIRMPGLDGVAMIDRIKKTTPFIKTILITGYSDEEPLARAINIGVDGLLKKPFHIKDLLQLVSLKLEEQEAELERTQNLLQKLSQNYGEENVETARSEIYPLKSDSTSTLMELGRISEVRQELDASIQAYEEALALISPKSPENQEFHIRLALSNLFGKKGDEKLSLLHAEEALELAEKKNDLEKIADACVQLGKILLENFPEKGTRYLEKAKSPLEKSRSGEKQALSFLLGSATALKQEKTTDAKNQLHQFLSFGKRHYLPGLILSFLNIAFDPLLLGLKEKIEPETLNWLFEEIAPFIQTKLYQTARSSSELSTLLSPYLLNDKIPSGIWLHVTGLGKFSMILDGKKIHENQWKSFKGRSLFLYLLHQFPQSVSEDHLLETYWGDLEPDKGKHSLRTTLYFVRRMLQENGRSFILSERQKYKINPEAKIYCDFVQFKNQIQAARQNWERKKIEDAVLIIKDAERLYKGDLLPGFSEGWCLTARDEMKESYVWMLTVLGSYLCSQKQWREAFLYSQKIIEFDPLSEEGYALAIETCLKSGRKDEAVQYFHRCREVLRKELKVKPSENIELLYRKALELNTVK
jgi:two-component SAPR family response regulator